jgi:hypothetical protein
MRKFLPSPQRVGGWDFKVHVWLFSWDVWQRIESSIIQNIPMRAWHITGTHYGRIPPHFYAHPAKTTGKFAIESLLPPTLFNNLIWFLNMIKSSKVSPSKGVIAQSAPLPGLIWAPVAPCQSYICYYAEVQFAPYSFVAPLPGLQK